MVDNWKALGMSIKFDRKVPSYSHIFLAYKSYSLPYNSGVCFTPLNLSCVCNLHSLYILKPL